MSILTIILEAIVCCLVSNSQESLRQDVNFWSIWSLEDVTKTLNISANAGVQL